MIIRENDCVGCETCINCGRRDDYYYRVCDVCGSDEQLYYFDEEELCTECLLKNFRKVDMNEY